MELGLRGLKALVTGGTRGIGRGIVEALAAQDAAVAFCARTPAHVAEAEATLRGQGRTVHGAVVDVADPGPLQAWIERASQALGGLDVLVANVSAAGGGGGAQGWRASLDTDLLGCLNAVEAALPHLARSNAPSITVIASTAAIEVPDGSGAYHAIKAALVNQAAGLARTLGPRGIRVNCVSPGPVLYPGGFWQQSRDARPGQFEAMRARIPLGRMVTVAEVARAVCFLASPAASGISGTNLVVDGAMTQRVQY
ncbi:MAG: SDR family oxidoreductase [Sneathiellaceae bacterium]